MLSPCSSSRSARRQPARAGARRRPTRCSSLYVCSRSRSRRDLAQLVARRAAGGPDPPRRHGGVHRHRLFDQRLHQPVLPVLHPAAAVGGDPLGLAGDRADRDHAGPALPRRRILSPATSPSSSQRFIVRTGHLAILSAILIWFGIHQRFVRLFLGFDESDRRWSRGATRASLRCAGDGRGRGAAGRAAAAGRDGEPIVAASRSPGAERGRSNDGPIVTGAGLGALLFDPPRDRALRQDHGGSVPLRRASTLFDVDALTRLDCAEGLTAEVRAGTPAAGWCCGTSPTFGRLSRARAEFGRAAGAVLDRYALLAAMEEGAAARTRLSLARDVHDSVVQFLRAPPLGRGDHARAGPGAASRPSSRSSRGC